ncbi:MAG TPA: response regulator [Clostridia bacterium]|nr:response regulator [Clostridia bacterium]
MIKAVLIDDERPALRGLEHMLKEYPEIEIAGMFTNPLEAIDKIAGIRPQIAFLDINMPQLQGIDAAAEILDRCPDTDIIFVTAYDQYAIEAFELHALDYVLKPVSKERFDKTISRIVGKGKKAEQKEQQKKFEICALGKFQAGWKGGRESIKWRTEKTKELFAFLLHNAGRAVTKDDILEAVYWDMDIEKAVHQLHNGIYYIRKTFEKHGVEKSQIAIEGKYLLKLGDAVVDSLQFKRCIKRSTADNGGLEAIEAAEALYAGDYFEGMDWMWAEAERESLRKQYTDTMVILALDYIRNEKLNKAEGLLHKLYTKDPYVEKVSELLIRLYKDTNRRNEAVRHYQEYERLLRDELGILPSKEISKFLKEL